MKGRNIMIGVLALHEILHETKLKKECGVILKLDLKKAYDKVVDVGPTGFRSDVTTSHGPWPGPRTKARRGTTSATLNSSRIGQTSWIPMENNF
jgi:hypothetical protein